MITKKLQFEKSPFGFEVIDTPGLAGYDLIKESALEITKALKLGGNYKIIFVCRIYSGRIWDKHITSINQIMESITHHDFIPYGIVLNFTKEDEMKMIPDVDKWIDFMNTLLSHKTELMKFLPFLDHALF